MTSNPLIDIQKLVSDGYVKVNVGIELSRQAEEAIDDIARNGPSYTEEHRQRFFETKGKANLFKSRRYGLGGFGAPGQPEWSNWKSLRSIYAEMASVLCSVQDELDYPHLTHYEVLSDRTKLRPKGDQPSPEAWHRDLSTPISSDILFGSFLNCNQHHTQHFVCCPGSHHHHSDGARGFTRISKEDRPYWKSKSVELCIHPGEMLIFYESIVHEVRSTKLDFDLKRIFQGLRLTKMKVSLFPGARGRRERQEPLYYKALGQAIPPTWPLLYQCNHLNLLEQGAAILNEKQTETYTVQSGKNKGKTIVRPLRFARGLKAIGCPQPDWTEEEHAIFGLYSRKNSHHTKAMVTPSRKRARELDSLPGAKASRI